MACDRAERGPGIPIGWTLLLGLLACGSTHAPTLAERFGDWPFLIPIDAPATVALQGGGEIKSDAATCGGCHSAFYAEWSESSHASALHDLQFMAELQKASSPRWLCLNCHIPTAVQRDVLITPATHIGPSGDFRNIDAAPNPAHDPARVAEGISCATCHVRRDTDGQGIILIPHEGVEAPHRSRVDPAALSNICVRCHSPGPAIISPTLFCWFETADEVEKGPAAGTSCTGCHMPPIDRPVAASAPTRPTRGHGWAGGGVPKTPEGYESLLERGYVPGVEVAVSLDPVVVSLHNTAGHSLPTADPERFFRVEARLEDTAGATLSSSVLRIGQRWDWGDEASGRPAHRLSDERLGPGETRRWTPTLDKADGATVLVVELIHVRLNPSYAAGMRSTRLDPKIQSLWREASVRLLDFERYYPLATWVYRERIALEDRSRLITPLSLLLEESRALTRLPTAELERLLSAP